MSTQIDFNLFHTCLRSVNAYVNININVMVMRKIDILETVHVNVNDEVKSARKSPLFFVSFPSSSCSSSTYCWDLVAHPVTQIIGEQALVDILDLSEVAWTCWGCFYTQQEGL